MVNMLPRSPSIPKIGSLGFLKTKEGRRDCFTNKLNNINANGSKLGGDEHFVILSLRVDSFVFKLNILQF